MSSQQGHPGHPHHQGPTDVVAPRPAAIPQQATGPQYAGSPPQTAVPPQAAVPPWYPATPATGPGLPPGPPTGLPFGLTPADGAGALRVLARSFLPVLGGLSVLVAVLALLALPDENAGNLGDWLRTAVVLTALSMGGRLVADGSVSLEVAAAEMSVGVRLIPLTVTVVLLALVARFSARAERQDPSAGPRQVVVRSVVTGLLGGAALALAALLGRASGAYGVDPAELGEWSGGIGVGAGAPSTFLGTTLLVSLAAVAARSSVAGVVPLPAALTASLTPELRAALGVLRTFAVGLVATVAVLFLAALLYQAAVGDDLDGNRPLELGALLVLGANAVLLLCLGALGVPLAAGAGGSGNRELLMELLDDSVGSTTSQSLTLFDYKPALLALLVPVLVALGTGVRRSLGSPAPLGTGRVVKLAAGIGAVAALALAFLVRVSIDASGSGTVPFAGDIGGTATASAGPSLLWAPLLGAAWAVAAVWAVRCGPTLALSLPARVTRVLAGRSARPEWAAALAGTAYPPAGRRSPAVRGILAGFVVVAALGVAGAVAVVVVNAVVLTPDAAAQEYLEAAADADVQGVLGHLELAPTEPGVLLDADVLAGEDFVPISGVAVGEVIESDDYATVAVTYAIGERQVEDTIDLAQGEKRYGVLRTWKVVEQLPTVQVMPEEMLGARIGGRSLAEGSHPALPGGYTVHAEEHALLTAEDSSFVVTTDASAGPTLNPIVKPEAIERAEEAVRARLEVCAASTATPLSDCPFFNDLWSVPELTGMNIQITAMPQFVLEYDWYLGGLVINTVSEGEVRVTGLETTTYYFLEPDVSPYDEVIGFDVDGSVTGSGQNFLVEFDEW